MESSFSLHQRHVISLLIHGFLSVNARLLIAFGTAFYAIIIVEIRNVKKYTVLILLNAGAFFFASGGVFYVVC